jgi:small conductance mechanosensitive channel
MNIFLMEAAETVAETVAETESETMGLLTDEIAEQVSKWQGVSLSELLGAYIPTAVDYLLRIVLAFVIFWLGKKIINLVVNLCDRGLARQNVELTVRRFLKNVIHAVGYVVVAMIMCQLLGIAVTSLAAAFATVGVAVGLALQGSLSNFAGGVLILLMKPFVIGDYIVAAGNEGVVKEIGIVYTQIQTGDNRIIMVPNGSLSDTSVVNVTRNATRRVDITVGISYEADLHLAKKLLQEIGEEDPARLKDQDVTVFVSNLGDSAVELGLRVWVAAADYWNAKWRMTETIKDTFDREGVAIPYPQMDVHMHQC